MGSKIIAPMEIKLDATDAINKINDLIALFKLKTSTLENVPEHIVDLFLRCISSLVNNIVLSDCSTTIPTSDINEIVIKVEIIGSTDLIASAIRTGDFQRLASVHSNTFS